MYTALAPSGLLLPHGGEAHLSSAGAADRHPVPVEDERFACSQQLSRLRCQAHVENVETKTVHVMSLPKPPNAKLTIPTVTLPSISRYPPPTEVRGAA